MSPRIISRPVPRAIAKIAPSQSLAAGWLSLTLMLALVVLFLGASLARGAETPGDEMVYPVGDFKDGKARHYSLKSPEGITVRYFLLKAPDGGIRAAFDACDVCWRSGKGYAQEGDNMICRNCGRRFASAQVGQKRGGCNPGPLALSVQGDQVRIKKADIYQGQHYFDLKR
ncbi:MAG: DUF2318 domain-containing protein [Desulfarculus sp.]|nr:DUF2318 domain-containing protein [Desulfarculus sp.]